MGGARLCVHASAGGHSRPPDGGPSIEERRRNQVSQDDALDAFWVHTNAFTTANIFYPTANGTVRNILLATGDDLSERSTTYPEYSYLGDQLAHAIIRLFDATGCYPMRTLRGGATVYRAWSQLVTPLREV